MSNLTNSTSHFSVTEKVQYALKTALFRTMQTAFGDSGSSEKAAPPRIFPKDIMQTNLVEIGKGDIDDDGYFVSRSMGTGYSWSGTNTLAPLDAVELIVAKYRIIDPTTNIITSLRVETLAGDYSGKTQSEIDNSMPPSGETYPKTDWFFRGHYTGNNDSEKFSNANTTYDGLQLAWDKATPNTVATEADIVPHLKYYLQVQTNHTGESEGNSLDNHTYIHDKMKGLIGLESNFTSTISVNRGEGGNCTNLNTTGTAAGEYWFTQATSGTLAFYGVGTSGQGGSVGNSLVNANDSLSNLSSTKFPMISYVRYVGETGFGAGSGGGSLVPDMGAVRFESGEILYDFTSHTFTTGGNTGRYGPQLQTVINAYSSTTWASNSSYFGTNGAGIQKWTVPETATYTITAYGADAVNSKGGKGAIITGDFLLKKGEVIEILCGQRVSPYDTNNHCGAGGSFVVRAPYNTVDSILVIAGGGGGAHNLSGTLTDDNIDKHAQPGTKAGSGTSYGTALRSGSNSQYEPNGGRHGGGGGQPSTSVANNPGVHGGAGGGGFLTNGESGVSGNIGGVSYVNGGTGGNQASNYYGGFGAGGSHGASHGGGGGGYTGGGGGRDNPHIGGGGGSYNSGVNKVALSGATDGWVGEGKVDIVKKSAVNYDNFTLNGRPVATGAAPLYDFDIHTFTPCGTTGKTGPSLSTCKKEYEPYWVTSTANFDVLNGIQKWTVPETGTYKITACGAAGGFGGAGSIMRVGGKGALLSGEFDLTKGQVINIVVGQMGQMEPTYYHAPGGGGGGTFITQDPHNTIASILIVAGGGGGAGQGVYGQNNGNYGHGRDAQTVEGYTDGRAGTRNGSYCSSGAGFTANGNGHQGTPPYGYTNNLTSSNVLKGGESIAHADESDGGFGGGGFGELGPGSGGGFCGGNVACSWSSSAEAYGGTSKMSDAARNTTFGHDTREDYYMQITGTQPLSNDLVSEMLNTRPGYVIIEKLIAIAEIEGGIDGLTSDNGNIGIGTTSPDRLLHLSADGSPVLKIVSTNQGSPGIELVRTSYNHSVNYDSSVYADDPWVDWKIKNNGGKLQFQSGVRASPNSNGAQTFVDAMSITHDGNVGIGTTDPKAKLHVIGNGTSAHPSSAMFDSKSSNQGHCRIGSSGTILDIGSYGGGAPYGIWMQSHNGSTNGNGRAITLQPVDGNVGIGTMTPYAKLQISGTSTNPSASTQSSTSSQGILRLHGTGGIFMDFGFQLSTPYAGWIQTHNGTTDGTGDDLLLQPVSGNVGIGRSSTNYKLDVNGDIRTTSQLYHSNYQYFYADVNTKRYWDSNNIYWTTNGNVGWEMVLYNGKFGIGTTSPTAKLHVYGNQSVYLQGSTRPCIFYRKGATGDGTLKWVVGMNEDPAENYSITGYNSAGHISLNPTGNVGIGTTSPQTKLDVAGDYSKNGEMISMTSQYGLNAKASIYRKWHREEDSNWGLYWINASSDFDYEDIMAYHATTDTSFTPTTGVTMSQFMSNYPPGDNGENIGSCSRTHGSYTHTTFPILAGRKHNYYVYSTIRTDADAWSSQPYRPSGDATNVMYTGYIKCNETATYYFGWYAKHYYRGLLFIQNPNEGTGKAWNFGYPGWQGNFQCRTNGVDMTAGKYYKFTFLMKGSGYYYYSGAVGNLGWSQSSANWSDPGSYYAAHVHSINASGYLHSTRTIDSVSNWQTRFGWISDDSPLQFVKRIPN